VAPSAPCLTKRVAAAPEMDSAGYHLAAALNYVESRARHVLSLASALARWSRRRGVFTGPAANSMEFPIAYSPSLKALAAPALLTRANPAAPLAPLQAGSKRARHNLRASTLKCCRFFCRDLAFPVWSVSFRTLPVPQLSPTPSQRASCGSPRLQSAALFQRRHHRTSKNSRAHAWSPLNRSALRGLHLPPLHRVEVSSRIAPFSHITVYGFIFIQGCSFPLSARWRARFS